LNPSDTSNSYTTFPIEWAIPFVNAAIPKLEELGLEFCQADWLEGMCEESRLLIVDVYDTIAHEDVAISIPHNQINNWALANSDRAAEYLLDLTLADAIFTGTTKPSTQPRKVEAPTYTYDPLDDVVFNWATIANGYYTDYDYDYTF